MEQTVLESGAERRARNRAWAAYAYHRGETVLRSLPEVFAIESTDFCNLKCVMCPRGEPDLMDRPLGSMSDALFRQIVDESEFYTDPVWFHWFGEPLMHPRLFDQIAYAKRAGVPNLAISTNGTLLDRKNAVKILDSQLDRILIAVDGARKETYEAVRKSATFTFEQVRANIEAFLALKAERGKTTPHTTLSIIVMEDNKDQLEAFASHWRERGADEILFKPFTAWGSQTGDFASLAATEQRALLQRALRPHPCRYLWESVVIAWDGRVVPCCFDYNATMVMGDLNTQTLADIWNSERYVRFRELELAGKNRSPLCRNCSEAPGSPRDPNYPAPV
ncbi:MAG: hypothetical protein QOJ39_2444 [Candidatus Eremiobacteraeota bacterium]|jgi:radical SAM protein with 4Fe4S-binding SPASM domain|nr:hypothetical protein [Candidatus Eremiobacteraeota bacterium]